MYMYVFSRYIFLLHVYVHRFMLVSNLEQINLTENIFIYMRSCQGMLLNQEYIYIYYKITITQKDQSSKKKLQKQRTGKNTLIKSKLHDMVSQQDSKRKNKKEKEKSMLQLLKILTDKTLN